MTDGHPDAASKARAPMTIAQAAQHTRAAVLAGKWSQREGKFSLNGPCCVGAKLAHCLEAGNDYLAGADAFAQLMGATRAHVILLLRQAGAGFNPLSGDPWPHDREMVWNALAQIEAMPDLRGANLQGVDLECVDLRGADLRGAVLCRTNLRGANLRGTDLRGADLRGACLEGAKLRGTGLEGA